MQSLILADSNFSNVLHILLSEHKDCIGQN